VRGFQAESRRFGRISRRPWPRLPVRGAENRALRRWCLRLRCRL